MRGVSWILLLMAPWTIAAELAVHAVDNVVMPLERHFDGRVSAVHQATVSAETSARVQELLFDVGDTVPRGAVILRLVSTEQRENLKQSEAVLLEAKANLDAETDNFERRRALWDRKLIAKADLDQASARYSAAKAKYASAEAALKTARQRLSYTEVRAPFGGVVSARHVEIGEAVNPGTPLMSGFDPHALRVEVDLPQAAATQVRALRQARVIDHNGGEIQPSEMVLFPLADPATSTIRVRLSLPEQAAGLYPGQFVKVAFTVGETERLLVPAASVVYRSEVTGLYVVSAKGPQLRQVRVGSRFGDQVEVLAGLSPGERVALDPVAAGIRLMAADGGKP